MPTLRLINEAIIGLRKLNVNAIGHLLRAMDDVRTYFTFN